MVDIKIGGRQQQPGQTTWRRAAGYLLAVGGIAAATGVLWVARPFLSLGSVYLIYLVVVVGVAAWRGWGPSLLAAVLAFLAANFFFTPPIFTFTIAEAQDILALVIFLALATGTSQVMARLRYEAEEARRNAALTATLYQLSCTINQQQDLDRLLAGAQAQLTRVLNLRDCHIILNDPARPAAPKPAPLGTVIVPLQVGDQLFGRLEVVLLWGQVLSVEDRDLLAAFAEQIATAIQRDHLQEEATQAEVLRRTDALRAALVSAVAHDLRSPLGAIQVAASSLLSTRVSWSAADQREFAQTIVERVTYINRLINNLLAEGRIEAGKLRPQKELASIGDIIERVVERLAGPLQHHPVTLEIPAGLPLVPLDAVEIDEVLTNLLENAAKYTPPGTPIAVRAEQREGAVAVQVADAGPGIPAEHLPRIFDRYYRLQPERTRGSGLGLAIARGIVEAHGGRIAVSSQTIPPKGTTFTFTLPLPAAAQLAAEAAMEEARI